jgi:hypothetical protein
MSQLEAMMAAAGDDDEVAEPSETADETETTDAVAPPTGVAADGSTVVSEDAAEKAKAAEAAKLAATPDKAAARFAALARELKRTQDAEASLKTKERGLVEKEQAIAARESQAAERMSHAEKVLADPALLFAHLETTLGIKSIDDLKKHAQGAWERPKVAAKVDDDPAKRPLTRADLDQIQAQQSQQVRQNAAVAEFAALTANDEKYEAAALIYSERERVDEGERFARKLTEAKTPYSLEDLADMVNEKAKADARWQKLQKRTASKGATATTKTASADATKVADTTGRQSTQAKTLSNDVATERSNGASGRISHRERLARLAAS